MIKKVNRLDVITPRSRGEIAFPFRRALTKRSVSLNNNIPSRRRGSINYLA